MTSKTSTWRKEPPTAREVESVDHWWIRSPGIGPRMVQFEENRDGLGYWDGYDLLTFEPGKTHPADAEWAPCLPPEEDDDPECLGVRLRVMRSKVRDLEADLDGLIDSDSASKVGRFVRKGEP